MEGFEYILLYTINLNSPSQNVETQCPRPPRCIPAKRHPRSKHRKFTFRETISFTSLIITLSAQGPRCKDRAVAAPGFSSRRNLDPGTAAEFLTGISPQDYVVVPTCQESLLDASIPTVSGNL